MSFSTVNRIPNDSAISLIFDGVTTQTTEHFHCIVTGLSGFDDRGPVCYILNSSTIIIENIAEISDAATLA